MDVRGHQQYEGWESALAELEGGYKSFLCPSGLSAITASLLAFVNAGDHIMVTDSVYLPTRRFCEDNLSKLGVETTFYDPLIAESIADLIRPNTKLIFTESPGSQTLEIQDIPKISSIARDKGIWLLMDNTWATPLYFKAFSKGIDVSIHAATKYIVGHADAMLGVITTNKEAYPHIKTMHENLGLCPGPEDAYLALRGLRTLDVRLQRHGRSAIEIAKWLKQQPEVSQVLHPALDDDPGNKIWQRDFLGSTGLFFGYFKNQSKRENRCYAKSPKAFWVRLVLGRI